MSPGDLREENVEGIRGGSVADPPLSHVIALARAFAVEPSYLVNGTEEAALDAEIVGALGDDTTRAITEESAPSGSGTETGPGHSAAVRRGAVARGADRGASSEGR